MGEPPDGANEPGAEDGQLQESSDAPASQDDPDLPEPLLGLGADGPHSPADADSDDENERL